MSSGLYLINQSLKAIKKVELSTYISIFIVLLINIYGLYPTILGKVVSILSVIYLILNNNITFGIIGFLIILLLNNGNVENFENKDSDEKKTEQQDTTLSSEKVEVSESKVEINDPIASFKAKHCKNGNLLDNDGKTINISDLSSVFPHIKFNIENEKCNPCEDNCDFKLTSETERIAVEEKLRPTSSTQVSSE